MPLLCLSRGGVLRYAPYRSQSDPGGSLIIRKKQLALQLPSMTWVQSELCIFEDKASNVTPEGEGRRR